MRALAAVLLLGACYRADVEPLGTPCPDDVCPSPYVCGQTGTCVEPGGELDAPSDTPPPDTIDQLCAGHPPEGPICISPSPTNDLSIASNASIDSDTLCTETRTIRGTPSCVVYARTMTLASGATLTLTGTKPLVLVAAAIQIQGTFAGDQGGPGASLDARCVVTAGGLASGAPGGSGFGQGGTGGPLASTGTGAAPGPAVLPDVLQGGCKGGTTAASAGGAGGGAFYFAASSSIVVTGTISVNGGGGGAATGGGGGGGAGGMIVLDAPSVLLSGGVFANGGGGAGGGIPGGGQAGMGQPGSDGADTQVSANGGAGADTAGDGGRGAANTMLDGFPGQPGSGTQMEGAGGGGGGAAGYIGVIGVLADSGVASPAVTHEVTMP
ncbi:MAG TPA: hypothetical protein VGM88_27460 [Kofleriaceae bacterium]